MKTFICNEHNNYHMEKKGNVLKIDDTTYVGSNEPLGKCEDCSKPAYNYDEWGKLLCEDCLHERHSMGEYDDDD